MDNLSAARLAQQAIAADHAVDFNPPIYNIWKVSERVAILKAIETKQEGRQPANRQNFASKDEAAKQAGFGNERKPAGYGGGKDC